MNGKSRVLFDKPRILQFKHMTTDNVTVTLKLSYLKKNMISLWQVHAKFYNLNTSQKMRQTPDWGICNSRLVWSVDFWGLVTKVSLLCLTVSADDPRQSVQFTAHRQSLCWNFLYHSWIVLSVGSSVWYLAQNLCCTTTNDSVSANSKTQNAFLSPVLAMYRHDCPLTAKPASMPWCLLPKQTWEILYLLISLLLSAVFFGYCTVEFRSSRGTYEFTLYYPRWYHWNSKWYKFWRFQNYRHQ
jgi:hypothetical protein